MHTLWGRQVSDSTWGWHRGSQRGAVEGEVHGGAHTDLVEATLVREDGDVSVVACASCMTRGAVSICNGQTPASGGDCDAPDMMAAGVYVVFDASASAAALGGGRKL